MQDPVKEIESVVRKITEPYSAAEIADSIDKYFTEDAHLLYPVFNLPYRKHGKRDLKGIYKLLRVLSINNHIEFRAIMFSENRLNATLDLIEYLDVRFLPALSFKLHFISRVDLRKESDGKYRICRQEDNYPNDLKRSGIRLIPGLATYSSIVKELVGIASSIVGRFLLRKGWFGP